MNHNLRSLLGGVIVAVVLFIIIFTYNVTRPTPQVLIHPHWVIMTPVVVTYPTHTK
jgi:hypothetical protein